MVPTASRDESSTSATRRSPRSPRSRRASPTSRSAGSPRLPGLTPTALRDLARRHGIRPRKSLGQHFLIDPALARRIVELAGAGPGGHVLEVGAGLGSLTVVLAGTGADVIAVEVDPGLVRALREVTQPFGNVRVIEADAVSADWQALLPGRGPWSVVANLPYNVAVPVVMRLLEEPRVDRMLVMVQREVGERLAAGPGEEQFGAVSLRVAYRAEARVIRSVARSVFWPRPNVDSVLVSLIRRPPPVNADEASLWRVIEEAFSQRRKNMRGAMVRLGLDRGAAARALSACGIDPSARPEQLGLSEFACLAEAWVRESGGME